MKLYNQTYCKDDNAVVETLFTSGVTANGTYKVLKNRIELKHTSGATIAIVRERGRHKDATSALVVSKSGERFSFSTSLIDERLFNIPDSYMAEKEQANALLLDYGL